MADLDPPPFAPDPWARARALLDLGRAEAAEAEARRLLALSPTDPEALELLGLCLLRRGNPSEALEPLRRALAAAPGRSHLHYLFGFASNQVGDGEAAERGLAEAVRLDPDEPVYLRARAEFLAEQERFDEALVLARKAVMADSSRAANHRSLGYVASARGDLTLSEEAYRKALELDPTDADGWNNLGCVLLARGDRLRAREHFREALRLDPQAPRAQRNLRLVTPPARPRAIYDDVETFFGEVLRELVAAGRLGVSGAGVVRVMALGHAFGRTAVRRALTARATEASTASRVGVVAGTAVAAVLARSVMRTGIGSAAAVVAGVTWLATVRKVTPLRHRYVAHVGAARREWKAAREAWLDGRLTRSARDARIDQLLERLCLDLDEEPLATELPAIGPEGRRPSSPPSEGSEHARS